MPGKLNSASHHRRRTIFAAHKTIEIALALNLEPCFTFVESPESNGMAEAFVKTFKHDYVRITALPGADTALALIEHWMEDYNVSLRSGPPCRVSVDDDNCPYGQR